MSPLKVRPSRPTGSASPPCGRPRSQAIDPKAWKRCAKEDLGTRLRPSNCDGLEGDDSTSSQACRGQKKHELHPRRLRGMVAPQGTRRPIPRGGLAPGPVRWPLPRGGDQLVVLQAPSPGNLRPLGRIHPGLWGIPSGYRFEPPAYFANAISGMVPPSAVQIPL
jgi:hypothetical protein